MAFEGLAELVQQARNQNFQNREQQFNDTTQFGGQLGGSIGNMISQYKQKQLLQQLIQKMQNQGAPQQGPQMPGMGAMPPGQAGPPQQPMSGMGAPPADNTQQMKALMMQLDPQGMMQNMETQMFQPGMNPLQQSEIEKNRALALRAGQPPQQKPTNPLDDILKKKRAQVLQAILNRMANPPSKPVNPVPAAALDLRAQIANNQQAPWYKKLGFAGGIKPVVNPLKSQSGGDVSSMSDEELMAIVNQSDEQ